MTLRYIIFLTLFVTKRIISLREYRLECWWRKYYGALTDTV